MVFRQLCLSAWLVVCLVTLAKGKAVEPNVGVNETVSVSEVNAKPNDVSEDSGQDKGSVVWTIDGINYSDIPEGFRLAAYMQEFHPLIQRCHRRDDRLRDVPSLCQSDECTDLMKKYEEWREKNGLGTASGRWG